MLDAGNCVLESHPELVFAGLEGKPLGWQLAKRTLQGILKRFQLLQAHGVKLDNVEAERRTQILSAQDALDAGAMALVALGWERNGDQVSVIRGAEGEPEALGAGEREPLMALPERARASRGG